MTGRLPSSLRPVKRHAWRCKRTPPPSSIGCQPRQPRAWFSSGIPRVSAVSDTTSHLPRLAQPSLWETIFPKALRQKTKEFVRPPEKRPSNPASYFIWIYLLIGSQAIRILSVKNESEVYMRRADIQIAKLREVIRKLQQGEEVDVEKALGTGDETEEAEWENALREIEREDRAWQINKKEKDAEKERSAREKSQFEEMRTDASPLNAAVVQAASPVQGDFDSSATRNSGAPAGPGFY